MTTEVPEGVPSHDDPELGSLEGTTVEEGDDDAAEE